MQVIVKRRSTDELEHGHKYLKKEKVNGKWRYYYDTDQLKADVKKAASEVSRTADNARYDVEYEALKLSNKKKLYDVDKSYKGNSNLVRKAKRITAVTPNTIKAGRNRVLRALNNTGNGRLDNKLREKSKKAQKWLKDLFK